jgi:hypothetical protein
LLPAQVREKKKRMKEKKERKKERKRIIFRAER